jgi:4-amino-4-deoxy-L-arabinose transferase-like glycosyltransferase
VGEGIGLSGQASILSGLPLRIVQVFSIALVLLKFAQLLHAGVFMDEAYYWMWGRHPALSYYDHPPLNAWLLSLSSSLLGWNVLALRAPVALTFLADILALYLLARRIGGEDWRGLFWLTLLLFLTTPIFWLVSSYALPDHALLTATLFAIYFFFRFFQDRASGTPGTTRDLLLGAAFLGLAALAKYNAAFLGLGVALFVLGFDRPLLRQPRLYLAALLTLMLQLPVLIWNANEGFASFGFIAGGRHAGLAASFDGLYPLALGILIFISPFLFWPILKFAIGRNAVPGSGFARAAFLVSTIAIVALAFTTLTLFHWNLIAYAAMLPFLAFVMRPSWLLVLQALYGTAIAVAIFVNYAIVPITDVGGWRDEATAWSYGWSEAAVAARDAAAANNATFIAAMDYPTASLLGFHMHDRDVVSIAGRRDQFDFWFDPAAHAGEDAILYGDRYRPLPPGISAYFDSITEIGAFAVAPRGRDVNTQRLYLAKGFKPNG